MSPTMAPAPSANGHTIHAGDVFVSAEPAVVRTILGSCIAVCLYDPGAQVGGMNHFMLPGHGADLTGASGRYGVHAMELLINRAMGLGADRRRLEAKVLGGGHVLRIPESADSVGQCNIRFVRQFLETEQIYVASEDVGGRAAREVRFHTDSGRILLRRIPITSSDRDLTELERTERANWRRAYRQAVRETDDSITLF